MTPTKISQVGIGSIFFDVNDDDDDDGVDISAQTQWLCPLKSHINFATFVNQAEWI